MPSTHLDHGRRMLQDDDAMVQERLSCQTSTETINAHQRHARCAMAGTKTASTHIGSLRRCRPVCVYADCGQNGAQRGRLLAKSLYTLFIYRWDLRVRTTHRPP